MTQEHTSTSEMDHLDELGAKAFDGFLVRKDLVRKYSRQYPVPTYVVEFLLGRYCASTDPAEIEEGLQIVEKQLQGRTVRLVRFGRRCDTGVMAGHHDKVVHTHEAQGQEGDHDKAWKHVSHRPHLTIVTRAECARAPKPLSRL